LDSTSRSSSTAKPVAPAKEEIQAESTSLPRRQVFLTTHVSNILPLTCPSSTALMLISAKSVRSQSALSATIKSALIDVSLSSMISSLPLTIMASEVPTR